MSPGGGDVSPPMAPEPARDRREVRLRLEADSAHTSTILSLASPRRALDLVTDFADVEVATDGVGACRVDSGVVRLRDVCAGARVVVSGKASFGAAPHGLSRFVDPVDGRRYVIGSGALGAAPRFLACGEGPADRMATEVVVESPGSPHSSVRDTVRAGGRRGLLASHHLGLAAGPWRVTSKPGVELLSRQSLGATEHLDSLLDDTRLALDWLLDWFGVSTGEAPWGAVYTEVLLPHASWLAMEHPGCVLLSERLLGAARARRVAVLAHEAAHQWLGNLLSPRTWVDVGVFEGVAELLGQLASEAIAGPASGAYLARRRESAPLPVLPNGPDLRTLAATAGLAEVAGPVQHAELFRTVLAELGPAEFRDCLRRLVRRHADSAVGSAEVWEALGTPPREPRMVRLPTLRSPGVPSPWRELEALAGWDPAAAAASARRAFRAYRPGSGRVRATLAALADPATPGPVVAGLAAELSLSSMY